jgi:anthranilate synthase component 1
MNNFNITQDQFEWQIKNKKGTLIYKSLITSTSPLIVYQKISQVAENYSFLLESNDNCTEKGRFSVVGLMPDQIWQTDGNKSFISKNSKTFEVQSSDDIIDNFRKFVNSAKINWSSVAIKYDKEFLPSISSGVYGYFSYDFAHVIHNIDICKKQSDEIKIPQGLFIRPQILIVFDNHLNKSMICAPFYQGKTDSYQDLCAKIDNVEQIISDAIFLQINATQQQKKLEFKSNVTKKEYCNTVEIAKQYITAGDVFQVLPSQRLTAEFPENLQQIDFYQALKETNPSPFLFYFNFPDFILTGSSPEIMVAVHDGKIIIRPLAGTRKRGTNEEEDEVIAKELLSDPKEIAEHLMLIDLGRHDVGSVSENGSVEVVKKMEVEYYSHVMHISSTVEGKLKQGCDAVDALIAGFPAGTVSGAPKKRAIEIIQQLENINRSFYAGCVGFFASNGNMETCITLRSALIKNGKIHLQAGAGVVFDSIAENEWQECINKMQALIKSYETIT